MREIKFRGKRIDNGEWVYGLLIRKFCCGTDWHEYFAIQAKDKKEYEVIPETVGQHTGLHDKNDKEEVYQDDIIDFFGLRRYIVAWKEKTGQWVAYVVGNKNIQRLLWEILKIFRATAKGHPGEGFHYKYPKVIGNIHDHPGLKEVKQ